MVKCCTCLVPHVHMRNAHPQILRQHNNDRYDISGIRVLPVLTCAWLHTVSEPYHYQSLIFRLDLSLLCCNADALLRCLKLVIQYPFNSMLHHHVKDIIITALAVGPPSLLNHLFQHCNLLHWLLTIPVSVTPNPRPGTHSNQ